LKLSSAVTRSSAVSLSIDMLALLKSPAPPTKGRRSGSQRERTGGAGFKIIASGLQQCMTAQANGDDRSIDLEQMEKLFRSLA
jgi:hypothetical protein